MLDTNICLTLQSDLNPWIDLAIIYYPTDKPIQKFIDIVECLYNNYWDDVCNDTITDYIVAGLIEFGYVYEENFKMYIHYKDEGEE